MQLAENKKENKKQTASKQEQSVQCCKKTNKIKNSTKQQDAATDITIHLFSAPATQEEKDNPPVRFGQQKQASKQ